MKANRGGRPRSEFREAVRATVQALNDERGPVSCREIAGLVPGINTASPAEWRLVAMTVENMARAGELKTVDRRREPGSCRPVNLYLVADADPVTPRRTADAAAQALAMALRAWSGAG